MSQAVKHKWLALALLLHGAVHGHPRHRDRERRAALDPGRPRVLAGEPAVGDQRLCARLRRVPPARRPPRRPPRPAAGLHGRPHRLHDRLAPVRARVERGIADRLPRAPGPRCGHDLARRALDPHRRRSARVASATSRSAPGARSAASAPPRASCSAASWSTSSRGSGSSSSTSPSAWLL